MGSPSAFASQACGETDGSPGTGTLHFSGRLCWRSDQARGQAAACGRATCEGPEVGALPLSDAGGAAGLSPLTLESELLCHLRVTLESEAGVGPMPPPTSGAPREGQGREGRQDVCLPPRSPRVSPRHTNYGTRCGGALPHGPNKGGALKKPFTLTRLRLTQKSAGSPSRSILKRLRLVLISIFLNSFFGKNLGLNMKTKRKLH